MAMTACSECKAAISTTAVACPHCGAKAAVLGNSSGIAILVAALFAAGLGSVMFIAILTDMADFESKITEPLSGTPVIKSINSYFVIKRIKFEPFVHFDEDR